MVDTTPASISSSVKESAGKPAERPIKASFVDSLLITNISSEMSGIVRRGCCCCWFCVLVWGVRNWGKWNDVIFWGRPRRRFLGTVKEKKGSEFGGAGAGAVWFWV